MVVIAHLRSWSTRAPGIDGPLELVGCQQGSSLPEETAGRFNGPMVNAAVPPSPHLMVFPYLPLPIVGDGPQALNVGDWVIGPVDGFEGRWRDPRFEMLSQQFARSFQDGTGRRVRIPAVVAHAVRGLDGVPPPPRELFGLQRAVEFAYLHANPEPADPNAVRMRISSDNTECFVWPIDLSEGRVARTAGLVVQRDEVGYRINPELTVGGPREVYLPALAMAIPDADLLQGIYGVATGAADAVDAKLARRVLTSINWLDAYAGARSSVGLRVLGADRSRCNSSI